jgi:nitrate reductase assembly molybdenum cofactor insertion protein NarJ
MSKRYSYRYDSEESFVVDFNLTDEQHEKLTKIVDDLIAASHAELDSAYQDIFEAEPTNLDLFGFQSLIKEIRAEKLGQINNVVQVDFKSQRLSRYR